MARRAIPGAVRPCDLAIARLVVLLAFGACAAPFNEDGTSASIGAHSGGALRHGSRLDFEGDGYQVPPPWRVRHGTWGTDEMVGLMVRSARQVAREAPGGVLPFGDLSHRGGGSAAEHGSHSSGRDADVFLAAVDRRGRPVPLTDAMLRFAPDGRAVKWSPPQGTAAPARPIPAARFDVRRNWLLVRALLTDAETEVQWIFIQRNLAALLLEEAAALNEDPALIARAAAILRQPTDAQAHDDHMHVRVYCDPADRILGCADRGPQRWWKKRWKYMTAPFGRDPGSGRDDAARALLRILRAEIPAALQVASPDRS